jgi:hypothetical protein
MKRKLVISMAAILVLLGTTWWWLGPTPPAMSSDSFQFVMATYRATQRKSLDQLDQISQQLESRNISTEVVVDIDKVIRVARNGHWNLASEQAFMLMKQQRR